MFNKIKKLHTMKEMRTTLLIICIVVIIAIFAYHNIMQVEEKRCWTIVENTAQTISSEITTGLQNDIDILHLAAEAIAQQVHEQQTEDSMLRQIKHLKKITIFRRIDILYADNTLLLSNGKKIHASGLSFAEIAAKGEHMSKHQIDMITGEDAIYYCIPIALGSQTDAVVMGMIPCDAITKFVKTKLYDEYTIGFLLNYSNENFVIKDWYDASGNSFEVYKSKKLKPKIIADTQNTQAKITVLKSKTSDQVLYMYDTPVGIFQWELIMILQEDTIFASLLYLKKITIFLGLVGLFWLLCYFFVNLKHINMLSESKEKAEQELETSTTLIQCVAELSQSVDINVAIRNLLQIINSYFAGDRTYIFEIDYDRQIIRNTYEYAAQGVTEEINNLQEVPLSVVAEWLKRFQEVGIFYISNIENEKRPQDDSTYNILNEQAIDSLVAAPLQKNQEDIFGFIGVDNPRLHCEDVSLLASIRFFVLESLEDKKRQEQLQYLSFFDTLTHLYNRNKFNEVQKGYQKKTVQNIGVAYFDVNGLKKANDTYGHKAGDILIQKTGEILREFFAECGYRIGGDEFVVIVENIAQIDFAKKVQNACAHMQQEGVSISVGISWKTDSSTLEQQMKEADANMYQNKQEYYKKHPKNETRT